MAPQGEILILHHDHLLLYETADSAAPSLPVCAPPEAGQPHSQLYESFSSGSKLQEGKGISASQGTYDKPPVQGLIRKVCR